MNRKVKPRLTITNIPVRHLKRVKRLADMEEGAEQTWCAALRWVIRVFPDLWNEHLNRRNRRRPRE